MVYRGRLFVDAFLGGTVHLAQLRLLCGRPAHQPVAASRRVSERLLGDSFMYVTFEFV